MAYNPDYNPYQDIQKVYEAKVGWNTATTDEERKRQNEIANAARKNLEAYGYGNLVNQISADGADATATRKILEQYAPQPTYSDKALINKNNNEANQKINDTYGTIKSDKDKYYSEYDKVSDYVYKDVTETPEYKSAFDKIMPEYDLKAMQGRKNQLASGGSSNGGNIDSFAAANALRQQAALKAKGQSLAHQMGLDTYQAKVNNARGILSDLGVYQKDSWNAMGNIIDKQANEGQRLFENNLAENATMAEVTGYVPNEWTIKNDAVYSEFLNPDGTFKKEMENVDIQALINQTTDPATKKKLAVVRGKKALGNLNKYGQYLNQGDVAFMENGQITEARRKAEADDATVRETLKSEQAIADASNQNALDQIKAQTEGEKEIRTLENSLGDNLSKEELKNQTDKVISDYLYSPRKDLSGSSEVWKVGYETKRPQYIAAEKISDPEILESIKASLTAAGFDADKKIKEYKKNIAIEIAKIEGKDYNDEDVLKSIFERSNYKWVWNG